MSVTNSNLTALKENFNKNISNLIKANKSRRVEWARSRRFRSF